MNLLNTIKNLYEKVDPQDTGGAEETSMIMGQVKQMRHYLDGIEERVAKDGDVEEWVQNKLTKATDYLKSVYGYKLGKDDSEGINEEVELDEALDKKDEPKVKEIIKKLKGASKAHAGQADDLEKAVLDEAQKLFMFTTKAEAQKKAKEIGGKVLELKRAMDGNMFAVLHKDLTKEELKMSIGEGKTYGLTQSLLDAVKGVLNADNTNDVSDDGDEMDKVQPKALKKKFADRKDKDIDNDGDTDDSDEYLHKRRKAVSKAIDKEEEVDDKEVEKKAKAEKDVDVDDKDDNKKAMAKNADDDDEKSDEEKQKEKELIAKKSDRKEKIDTKPTIGESAARKRLSGMMKDKANVKNVRIPTPAERRAQMAKQNAGKKKNPNSIFASTNEQVELEENMKKSSLAQLAAKHFDHTSGHMYGDNVGHSDSTMAKHKRAADIIMKHVAKTYGKEVADAMNKNSQAGANLDNEAGGNAGKLRKTHSDFVKNHLGGRGSADHKMYQNKIYDGFGSDETHAESFNLGEAKFTDKQIKMAYGVLNDPRYKGGNLSGATKAIEKIARGLSKHPSVMKAMKATSEQVIVKELNIKEAEMTPEQEKKKEEIVMAMKKKLPEFEAKYGDRAKEVMYATATKMAMKT